jgi:PIN domain nuclease of toxin-antitoxin system
MKLLLDTHAFIWWIDDDVRLSTAARTLLRDRGNDAFVSIATIWEIAIKVGVGRLRMPAELRPFLADQIARAGFSLLPIAFEHVVAVHALPQHHRDPFDRLLIAQCRQEDLSLVSRDGKFALYDLELVW